MEEFVGLKLICNDSKFIVEGSDTVFKKCVSEEEYCFEQLQNDLLKDYVPGFRGKVFKNNKCLFNVIKSSDLSFFLIDYLEFENLLKDFENPSIMDVKMGIRTQLEELFSKGAEKTKLRSDLFETVCENEPQILTNEELRLRMLTKSRYLQWLDNFSCTSSLGFRIESVKFANGESKIYRLLKTENDVKDVFRRFVGREPMIGCAYLERLKNIKNALNNSEIFKKCEFIRTSLLFVHDSRKANVWIIDFEKTNIVPKNVQITHKKPWTPGNHEDGYLVGLDNIIRVFTAITPNL